MTPSYAGVYLLDAPYAIDRAYDYLIPRSLCDVVRRGSFVTVPFGGGNRRHMALVVELKEESLYKKVKPLLSVSADRLALDEHMLGLALFIKEQTLCTVGDAIRAMLPAAALLQASEIYSLSPNVDKIQSDPAHPEDEELLSYLRDHGTTKTIDLQRTLGATTDDSLRRLRERRAVVRDAVFEDVDPASYTTCRRLRISCEEAILQCEGDGARKPTLRSEKQKAVIRSLLDAKEPIPDRVLCERAECTVSVLKTLTDHGVLEEYKLHVERIPYELGEFVPAQIPVLNEEQKQAYLTLCDFADDDQPHAALLHGVTGSGKTAVMLALIAHLLGNGKSAIVLLPEIALTPQSIAIFCSHFGHCVAVIHSGLSAGERYDAYERIRRGEAKVVVGTRSAVFAPVKNLGAIIIDEEQEHTYKSDKNPKYRAHDIARYRCAAAGALMLLASATPSLESYYKAVQGKYTLIKLTSRYGKAVLPEVIVADTRRESATGNLSPLGTLLCGAIAENLEVNKQSILFLNRRGYHRYVSCRSCGEVIMCPRCSVAMTYHTARDDFSYTEGELVCHFCGGRAPLPKTCPACSSKHLSRTGYGTQRVEQELRRLFPISRVLRMDTDTTATKHAYDEMLGAFRSHEADILLGTQMVTKGHDFPDVTLVGVLSADASLYLDDYRASERTFSQLTQVIGRAGRAKTPGRAIIQTANPDNDVIRLACAQDYEKFYEREIKLRRLLVFPPFCDIALLSLTGEDEKALLISAKRLDEELRRLLAGDFADVQTVIFGPFEAPVYRVDNRYRMRIVIKCRLNKRSRALFSTLLTLFGANSNGVILSVDFNPSSL